MIHEAPSEFTPQELRAEAAFMRRRVRALEQAERALRRAADTFHANGDRDLADMLFMSWCAGDRELSEARAYLSTINRAAAVRRSHGAEPASPAMQAAA